MGCPTMGNQGRTNNTTTEIKNENPVSECWKFKRFGFGDYFPAWFPFRLITVIKQVTQSPGKLFEWLAKRKYDVWEYIHGRIPSAQAEIKEMLNSQIHRIQIRQQFRDNITEINPKTGQTDPKAIIFIENFITYLRKVENAYAQDSPQNTVTRIRKLYYDNPRYNQLIPDAIVILDAVWHDIEPYRRLGVYTDKNDTGPNYFPYLWSLDGEVINIGHVFLGLDALFHPNTNMPLIFLNIPNIDPVSWVACLGMASVRMSYHQETGVPLEDTPLKLPEADLATYYKMSAPEADLLGEADSYGLYRQCQWQANKKLSEILSEYYFGGSGGDGKETAGVKKRWRVFCAANGLSYELYDQKIAWTFNCEKLIARINRFNNLYYSGWLSPPAWTVSGASQPDWSYTGTVVKMFLKWLKGKVEGELADGS